ncbi:MAG: rod shape-determining protein RodA [Candidatus Ratteibacteria bacterium]
MDEKISPRMVLFIESLLLSLIGLLLLFSASKGVVIRFQAVFLKQLVWVAGGIFLFFGFRNFDYRHWRKLSLFLYFFFIILLILVFFVGHGRAGRWIRIGFFNFQPSEFMKFVLIVGLAGYFSERQVERFSVFFGGLCITMVPFLLVLLQPNLGTAFLLLIIFFSIAYLAGAKRAHLFSVLTTGLLASPFFWMMLKDYQKQRILIFLNPWKDPLGKGYNILQSKITIGSGGIIGKGFLRGTQTKLAFLPEYHTDFIFCLLAEEFGLIGVLALLVLYYIFLKQIYNIMITTKDHYGRLIGGGVTALFFTQIFVNIGMASGILPVAGIPLPFLSYGGSALLVSFFCVAILYNLSKNSTLF